MTDIWAFLLQTLTASGTAVLLLALKAMFQDKLPPRWQFAAWGVLALVLLFPAGINGRYALVNWPFYIELLKSSLTGEFGTLTQIAFPLPAPPAALPRSLTDWLFFAYAAGTVLFLARYLLSYARLRFALRRGNPVEMADVRETAERFGLNACPVVEADGLPSAFICGVFRPVLAVPAGEPVDEKVILHELLHLKYRDVLWGWVICFFRCLHWCNPLLWYCANRAANDLEALCDQRVLERLQGEDRRDYGRILLSMAGEKYSCAPGTSSMANGGKNIRRRIEAIARFKRYPRGMGLVSACVTLSLLVPLLTGAKAPAIDNFHIIFCDKQIDDMVSARSVRCTTYAGALDAYAKALLKQYIPYRAMCAPLEEQNALMDAYRQERENGTWEWQDSKLPGEVLMDSGYKIYNLAAAGTDAYEGLVVLELAEPPSEREDPYGLLAVQTVRVEKQLGRWVVLPQEEFWKTYSEWGSLRASGPEKSLPAWEYEAGYGDFSLLCRWQTSACIDSFEVNQGFMFSSTSFNCTPMPDGVFNSDCHEELLAYYTGAPENRNRYSHIAASLCDFEEGKPRPELELPGIWSGGGNSTPGGAWGAKPLEDDWESPVYITGGGGGGWSETLPDRPDRYAADLYLNGDLAAELTLLPVKGGTER
ncbi:MAG: M56 family metallopeptidase [Oscillospiraceae bacterium]|nr:M56 family metallopeptidase [Oscillospiraceae bacterium]